ncbi:mitochondrial matrix Mmp37-domain-containing protein [Peziza echinospora]|nr:mitochondrial matrix Mmp37-domain-containing protein [Peziza echinospora]
MFCCIRVLQDWAGDGGENAALVGMRRICGLAGLLLAESRMPRVGPLFSAFVFGAALAAPPVAHALPPSGAKPPPSPATPPPPPPPPGWEQDEPEWVFEKPTNLPLEFGSNQYMPVDDAFKEQLRGILWQFRAPVRYAFAYGSGVFSQDASKSGKKPMIDLIFGVTYSQHWHSLNIAQYPEHYSFLKTIGSNAVTRIQHWGAGVYFNPYVEINGMLIKYGVVNIDTLCRDLADWDTLYLAGRLHKPVKILRDEPRVRYSNQLNLLAALRTALLLLPENFTEAELYTAIAAISYTGDPRMHTFTENPNKVANIVSNQLTNFRRLYSPLIDVLPNLQFTKGGSTWDDLPETSILQQDMDPIRRANIIRRLPRSFRDKLYFQYQSEYQIARGEFQKMVGISDDAERMARKTGGVFEQRIAADGTEKLKKAVSKSIKKTIAWPSTIQSIKGVLTAGFGRSGRYLGDKMAKWKDAKKSEKPK